MVGVAARIAIVYLLMKNLLTGYECIGMNAAGVPVVAFPLDKKNGGFE